jgi:hypothetical protein
MPRLIATLGPGDVLRTAAHTYQLIRNGGVFCYSDGEHRPNRSGYSFEENDHGEAVRRFANGAKIFDVTSKGAPPGLWSRR